MSTTLHTSILPSPRAARAPLACLLLAALASRAPPQWNPTQGDWSPAGARDVRIVTFNVSDGICSTADKSGADNAWTALARLVAALEPDVVLLQEAGDNAGNGTGDGVDPVADLELTLRLFVRGGHDPFTKGSPPVGACVQDFAPSLRLPHVAVSSRTDGFNRNALLSRYPFGDLNGDGVATAGDMPKVAADLWAAGGKGGVRGFQMVEIDLPDETYAGDLLVGNSHLKAGTSREDHQARVDAARNVSYLVEHLLNGAGTGSPDPWDAITDDPPVTSVLRPGTLVVAGGDWNEDELDNGDVKGPAAWIVQAQAADARGGGDGTDRDGSDMTYDDARDLFTGSAATLGPWKRDYLSWQDAVGTLRQAFVLETASLPTDGSATPHALAGACDVAGLSALASDHRPVAADLLLPTTACDDALDLGYGLAAPDGAVPWFSVCARGRGGEARWSLRDGPPGALAVPVVGPTDRGRPAFGGTLVPWPPRRLPALRLDADGALEVRPPRGAGELSGQVVQWVMLDPERGRVVALSNALSLPATPRPPSPVGPRSGS